MHLHRCALRMIKACWLRRNAQSSGGYPQSETPGRRGPRPPVPQALTAHPKTKASRAALRSVPRAPVPSINDIGEPFRRILLCSGQNDGRTPKSSSPCRNRKGHALPSACQNAEASLARSGMSRTVAPSITAPFDVEISSSVRSRPMSRP